jgi:hypothetical protein
MDGSAPREEGVGITAERDPHCLGRRAFLTASSLFCWLGWRRRAGAQPGPSPGSWRPWNHPKLSRLSFSVTALADGRVLVVGGGIDPLPTDRPLEHSAEILDPKSGIWSLTDPLPTHAVDPAMVPLLDGGLLLAGGYDHRTQETPRLKTFSQFYEAPTISRAMLDEAWTWHPRGGWQQSGRMNERREGARGCRLGDGRVLVVGGSQILFGSEYVTPRFLTQVTAKVLASAEIWSPATGRWTVTRPMLLPRDLHSLTALVDGRVLAVGGIHSDRGVDRPSPVPAEVWEPAGEIWKPVARPRWERQSHTATRLRDGRVLVAGRNRPTAVGHSGENTKLQAVELWDPATDRWADASPLHEARSDHDAVLLADGRVLVAGGATMFAEIWDSGSDQWRQIPRFAESTGSPVRLAGLPAGRVLLVNATTTQLWAP